MSDVTLNEAKTALEEMRKAFEEHKKANDARLDALAKQKSGAEFDEKLDKIGEVINAQEKAVRRFQKAQEEAEAKRLTEIAEWKALQEEKERKFETRVNRLALGLGGAKDDLEDTDDRLHRKAFSAMLRKGIERLEPGEAKVLTVADDTTGGYLSPAHYEADIIKAEVLYSPMRPLVNVRQMSSGVYQQPKRTTTAAATWQGTETGTRAETTNPAWGLVQIPAIELYAEARISWANLEDSAFDLEAVLRDEFAEQFGVAEGTAIVKGTGVYQPQGFTDSSAGLSYTASGSSATIAGASGAEANGLIGLFHAVKTAYARNGVWALNRASLGKVRLLKDTTGHYLWQPGPYTDAALANGMAPTILGRPYVECPDMADETTNSFPIAFGDFKRAYTLVDRIGMSVVRDNLTIASTGQVKFFARRRVGGKVVNSEAVRLLKCATS